MSGLGYDKQESMLNKGKEGADVAEMTEYQFLEQLRHFDGSPTSLDLLAPGVRWQCGRQTLTGRHDVAEALSNGRIQFPGGIEMKNLQRSALSRSVIRWDGLLERPAADISFTLLIEKNDLAGVWQLLEIRLEPESDKKRLCQEISPAELPVGILRCEENPPFRLFSANAAFYRLWEGPAAWERELTVPKGLSKSMAEPSAESVSELRSFCLLYTSDEAGLWYCGLGQ